MVSDLALEKLILKDAASGTVCNRAEDKFPVSLLPRVVADAKAPTSLSYALQGVAEIRPLLGRAGLILHRPDQGMIRLPG